MLRRERRDRPSALCFVQWSISFGRAFRSVERFSKVLPEQLKQ